VLRTIVPRPNCGGLARGLQSVPVIIFNPKEDHTGQLSLAIKTTIASSRMVAQADTTRLVNLARVSAIGLLFFKLRITPTHKKLWVVKYPTTHSFFVFFVAAPSDC
jgi:hypothetical protein